MSDKSIKKALANLYIGEAAAALTFIFVLISFKKNFALSVDMTVLYPFALLIFILIQGSYYWFYCLRKIKRKQINKQSFRAIYRALRKIDLLLILFYPFIIVYKTLNGNIGVVSLKALTSYFIYVFAIIEYINYFYVRLSYSKLNDIAALISLKKLRQSSLYRELNK